MQRTHHCRKLKSSRPQLPRSRVSENHVYISSLERRRSPPLCLRPLGVRRVAASTPQCVKRTRRRSKSAFSNAQLHQDPGGSHLRLADGGLSRPFPLLFVLLWLVGPLAPARAGFAVVAFVTLAVRLVGCGDLFDVRLAAVRAGPFVGASESCAG
jgi:hypothetical protein